MTAIKNTKNCLNVFTELFIIDLILKKMFRFDIQILSHIKYRIQTDRRQLISGMSNLSHLYIQYQTVVLSHLLTIFVILTVYLMENSGVFLKYFFPLSLNVVVEKVNLIFVLVYISPSVSIRLTGQRITSASRASLLSDVSSCRTQAS